MNEIEPTLPSLEAVQAELEALKIEHNELEDSFYSHKDRVLNFFKAGSWKVLGYSSPSSCYDEHFGDSKLTKELRKELVPLFSELGDSEAKISRALGVHRTTVRSDLGKTGPVQNVQTEPVTTPDVVEPTEILPPEAGDKTAEELEADFRELLETNRAVLEPSVPYDITPDKAVTLAIDSSSGWMEMAVRVSKKDISSNTRAKIRIELQIMRDMIDMIEENL